MFAVIQYPFVDTRLLNAAGSQNSFFPPQFQSRITQNHYFRFLGEEKLRRAPESLPEKERTYFDSKAAISFLPASHVPLQKGVFKRLYTDDFSLHYDIGLHGFYDSFCAPYYGKYGSFIRDLMEAPRLRVTRRFEHIERHFSLYTFFDELLRIYQYATTSKKAGPIQFTPVQAGILPGTPAVIISYKSFELTSPTKAKWLTPLPDLKAGCSLLNLHNHPIAVYHISHSFSAAKSDEVRRLRICISKIHACKETLRLLLTYIEQSRPGNVKIEPSLLYLKKFLRLAEKEQYYGFDNQSFWELAYSIDEALHREQWLELIDRARGVVDLLERNLNFREVKVVGNITYENHNGVMIAGAKNTVIDRIIIGDSPKELNDALQDFSKEAERLLKEFEANGEEITELKEQIKTFCDSVKEKNPRKNVCNALLSGIKATLANASAIEKLGSLGIKIIELL